MSDLETIRKNDIINFDMIRPGIFGSQYKAATVTGIVDYDTACLIDPDVYNKHQAFYPFFKDSVDNVNNPAIYNYFVLQLDPTIAGRTVIGFPWIDKDSLKTIQSRYANVIIQSFQEYHRAPLVDFLKSLNVTYVLTIHDS
ncbi:hypothetical protein D5W64_13270 [Salmonella enterica subsp. enterica serovar Saintpaul]|nr:hypothetical protein [Salmonella enterica subsp. enterica serovar Saintpaul]